jgi:hypothetical protein
MIYENPQLLKHSEFYQGIDMYCMGTLKKPQIYRQRIRDGKQKIVHFGV